MPIESPELASPFASGLQMFAALFCVILLAYLVLHKGLGFILKRQRSGDIIKVRERLALDAKNALLVVEIEGKTLLLATGDRGVQVVLPSLKHSPEPLLSESPVAFKSVQHSISTGA